MRGGVVFNEKTILRDPTQPLDHREANPNPNTRPCRRLFCKLDWSQPEW